MSVKERPILMCGEMIRAVLEGRKTQTRRVVKDALMAKAQGRMMEDEAADWCPYGKPGERLWVKETWATSQFCDDRPPSGMEKPGRGYGWPVWYKTDGAINLRGRKSLEGGLGFTTKGKIRQSIFMPRWASRITLEIVSVRVERLQDITGEDAKAEGVPEEKYAVHYYCDEGDPNDPEDFGTHRCNWRFGFTMLWDSINAKTHPWSSNPWVWVIEFKKL